MNRISCLLRKQVAGTPGPGPLWQLGHDRSLLTLTVSMWPVLVSVALVSALPSSKQQPELKWVPEETMYMPSGFQAHVVEECTSDLLDEGWERVKKGKHLLSDRLPE